MGDHSRPGRRAWSPDELRALVERGEIETVVMTIVDMQGRLMGKRIPADHFLDAVADHGMHFCNYLLGTDMEMNCPPGYQLMSWNQGYGDWLGDPDWSTLRPIPWLERTALLLADVRVEGGDLVEVAPRTVLRSQVERAAQAGFSLKMASELEFYLLKDTYEAANAKGYQNLEPFGHYNEDYSLLQSSKAEPLYRRLRREMIAAGIPVEGSKGEAAPGQHEINIRYSHPLEAADRHAIFKHGAKEIGHQEGYGITFMAKPDHTWTGSSCHIHASLWDGEGGRNLFADPETENGISETMRWFLGGLIACARELAVLYAPTINSYKRYASLSWAPVHLVWARDNRTCGFRVVGNGPSLRIENRFPGADANPYLAFAAVIAAGLYGIEQQIDPGPEYLGNGYAAQGAGRVPGNLREAAGLLDASSMARSAFGDTVVDHYVNYARVEQAAFDAAVTSWERERYLERG